MFEHFEQCLDMLYSLSMCSNSVWTCYTPCPCVRTVFEQPAMQWCAVRTLFEQFVLVWQCSNTVQKCSDITHCFACCSNTVRTVFGHVILPFHAFEQCSNRTLMPTTRSESFLFLFPFSFSLFFLFTAIHVRPQAHPRMPIRNTSTHPSARSEHQ